MNTSVFAAFAFFATISSRVVTGQPVYSNPPCPDSGWDCDYSLKEVKPSPVGNPSCPDCIQRFTHHDEECVSTPGQGNYEFCGWGVPVPVPEYYQSFACNPGNSAAGMPFCDFTSPVGNKWDSTAHSAFVVRHSHSRECPPHDCFQEPR